ncbi:hypothetical protein [Actinoplanes sp. URMC 104]|uniref:hypothetical protein n=1 Tax=Actinoplanes sp. URMC 104 TaxID=3423409 RepID=UPI003F1E167F
MDQREWDYGARMSRERRAAEPWSSRSSDSPEFVDPEPKWSSLTDTGSMQPSAEALDWQRRADAWAQQAESDEHQSVEPANRWSDAASTGRTTFPADGVGWRTETAEWRATGARWRQTTEWRSTTGSHVWRSTTEAWQTGGNSSYPPATETPMAQPAISSTAWSDDADADSRPSWQEFADPATPSESHTSTESATPSWQQPSPRTPAESSPSWQALVEPQQSSWDSRPSWQRDAIEGSATWTDVADQRSAAASTAADTSASWLRTENPRDDGRHLVREDDRAAWRREPAGGSPSVGRRRAPEPPAPPTGGTGWSGARSDADNWENTDNWAGHTDTGSIQLYGDTPAPPSTSAPWSAGTGFGSRNVNRRDDGARRPYGDSPGYQMPPAAPYEPPPRSPRRDDTASARALPTGYDETPRPRYAPEDEPAAGGRRQRGHRYADEEPAQPSRGAGSYSPPEPRAPRRARSEPDETATFSAVPMPAPPPTTPRSAPPSASRSAPPYASPGAPSSASRSAPPYASPGAPSSASRSAPPYASPGAPSSASRSAQPFASPGVPPAAPRSAPPSAPRSGSAAVPRSAPPADQRGGSGRGRARYGGGADWREQTGSWEAEPDTSSWVRDPDTGQWSRSEDDPRILAWRREAARREAMGEGPPALPPAPADPEPEARPEPPTGGWRSPPPLPPAPAPRSAAPYGETAYSRGEDVGYDVPRSGGYGSAPAPRSAAPYGDTGYGPAPSSAVPARDYDDDRYDPPRGGGYGPTPRSAAPYGDTGYSPAPPTGRGYPDEPGTAYGSPVADPYGGRPALPSAPSSPRYSGAASVPVSSTPGYPDAYGDSPRSGRRRAAEDDVPARRDVVDPSAYAAPPITPEAWQPGPAARPAEPPPWSQPADTGRRSEPGAWQLEERRERARGSATYRDGGGADWRRELADRSNLTEGESRRFGTSDYQPFRAGGSAAVSGQSNLSTTSTSLISPVPREATAVAQRGPASWNGPSGAYERRPVAGGYPTGRKSDLLDPDDEEDDQESGGPLAAVGYTVIWYGVPVVLFVGYMLVLGGGAQGHALQTLGKAAPQFLVSLVLSVLVALGLRFVSHSWKAISVGLAAAVVGGGLATVLTSAITGNSLS